MMRYEREELIERSSDIHYRMKELNDSIRNLSSRNGMRIGSISEFNVTLADEPTYKLIIHDIDETINKLEETINELKALRTKTESCLDRTNKSIEMAKKDNRLKIC